MQETEKTVLILTKDKELTLAKKRLNELVNIVTTLLILCDYS